MGIPARVSPSFHYWLPKHHCEKWPSRFSRKMMRHQGIEAGFRWPANESLLSLFDDNRPGRDRQFTEMARLKPQCQPAMRQTAVASLMGT